MGSLSPDAEKLGMNDVHPFRKLKAFIRTEKARVRVRRLESVMSDTVERSDALTVQPSYAWVRHQIGWV